MGRNVVRAKAYPAKATPSERTTSMSNLFQRLIREEDGMEMVEWAIVGVVFAVAAAAFWGRLSGSIDAALGDIEAEVTPG